MVDGGNIRGREEGSIEIIVPGVRIRFGLGDPSRESGHVHLTPRELWDSKTAKVLAQHCTIDLTMNVLGHVAESEQADAIQALPDLPQQTTSGEFLRSANREF